MRSIVAGAALLAAASAGWADALPPSLRDTGFEAQKLAFAPRYALWSDGSAKRRWLHLPPGTAIDASQPDAWDFPPGTKLWKEFSHGGRRVETRFIERLADGSWRFAAYAWNGEGTEATLAPAQGVTLAVPQAPGGRYAVPSRADCLACHEGAAVPVLGFSAVQLPGELKSLAARGVLRRLPAALLDNAPEIAAPTPLARAALGYLHANCGHCHNDAGPLANVDFSLAQRADAPHASAARTLRSVAGRPADLLRRVRSSNSYVRMPPLGVSVIDTEGLAGVEQWISQLQREPLP